VEPFGWISVLIVLSLGIVLGMVIAHYAGPGVRRVRELEMQLQQARSDHESYRKEVTEHFSTTGDLVNEMTRGYRAVYEHLAKGAHRLTNNELVTTRLEFSSDEVPVLESEQIVSIPPGGNSPAGKAPSVAANDAGDSTGAVAQAPRDYPLDDAADGDAKDSQPVEKKPA